MLNSPKLIFDIETVGVEFDSLDDKAKEFLLFYAESPEEIENVKNGLGFSPLTGEVVAIGILNPDTDKGAVYFQAGKNKEKIRQLADEDKNAQYIPCSSEKEVLEHFWTSATHYNQFITFNGHSFDCPFVTIRSAILKIKPTKSLIHNRYYDAPHFDLYDRLTNFGAVRFKRNLHMWCQAFGISSPKAKGISGDDVARLFKEKEYLKIAKYCFDDIQATKELYRYWEKYIR
ncbi:MAG: ribonuclease H-like domain-containing protein [Candidatus Yanofskybacteria bacterium]|nr:ribonuclease H-like domain-containing protein [Candidatus Yanofskybacteria bacterium]